MDSKKIEEEKRIREFSDKVIESFHFLEKEYGYKRKELEKEYFDYPIERKVFIRYFSKKVAVEVVWYIGHCNIAVGLYELHKGKIPENVSFYGHYGYSRAINLDSLVRMLTDGEINSPLPERTFHISNAELFRRVEKSTELIRTNMSWILETFAERLKKYAPEILKGDSSIFPRVQEHHTKFWGAKI
ncbi:MAG: hypothetical protein PVH61_43695 [Candidatus Aminicenantes bacterium]|jgi:hypothetical protein